ncbi:2-succinyl-5-enolpyruvyl-6-hydroxy-3-cyclohexene-1-carboxylic-acid synthase [Streptomyces spectabilis]|uniref:2-succinyl-5-enolpyruvyl-6-hydroxy-3-cyclohexene-1-carboxylate synthase n=2 Tax=Streptomyces spectabilis TaxID=68270 RepID=A0A7W8B3Q7_STRST|nr:2-succinyl-5-enolpyruvyl-6-hydroxy-3-cyclohexene-1-carboxylic-acid synthase [Streptomyces spectabilis]MBB5109758.1 2-succinyl-5-enolpyruvyl-6-hydroxy-3-cyclohexene-1-carboxylate synthase [Streptomyces spectabilis]
MDELSRCGVGDVVISPGARSAPLAQAAYAHPRLRHHVRFDERSAGFLALGLTKGHGRPVPVICTSGTAAANLHPAVLEAAHSRLPLVILTADRPPELRGTGANQSTDQIKLYGHAVMYFAEVGPPELREGNNAYWRTLVCRALRAARAGPAHLNIALRDPLDFDCPTGPPSALAGRADGRPWTRLGDEAGQQQPVELDTARRGLVVAGDGIADPHSVVAFAEAANWPLLAEPYSNARYGPNAISTYQDLLSHPPTRARLMPESVLVVGRTGLSHELLGLYGSAVTHTVVDAHPQWADPTRTADLLLCALPRARKAADPDWLEAWKDAEKTARTALHDHLDQAALSEPRAVRDVLRLIPHDSLCLIGASMPIRDADRTMAPRRGPRIIANRGLSGIDGAVSTAIGAALAHQDGRAFAILGDLSLLHDANGLMIGPNQPRPDLTIIVINNDGGGIFSLVDHTCEAVGFEALFGTPHNVCIADLASAVNWRYSSITSMEDLPAFLAEPGPLIIEIRTERAANAAFHHQLRRYIHTALERTQFRTACDGPSAPKAEETSTQGTA